MIILGLDYGTQRIGIALATTSLAEPLTVIPNDNHTLTTISQLARHHQADLIVIGLSEGYMAQKTRQFAHQLSQVVNMSIKFFDETLTSHQARQQLLHQSRRTRSLPQDAYQAALILQAFLDAHQNMLELS